MLKSIKRNRLSKFFENFLCKRMEIIEAYQNKQKVILRFGKTIFPPTDINFVSPLSTCRYALPSFHACNMVLHRLTPYGTIAKYYKYSLEFLILQS